MQQGVDYDSSFAPCARIATIRMIMAISVRYGWIVQHGDVPNAYLNGVSQKTVIVRLPDFWDEIAGDHLGKAGDPVVCVKSLYGSPDAGRNWNSCQHRLFMDQGYSQCAKEPCVYFKRSDRGISIFAIWVDDNFITGDDKVEIDRMIGVLKN